VINQNIEFIRAYFLSFDEEEQEKIFSSLSDEQKDLIVEAGVVFLSNGGVETISDNSSLIEHKRELKEVQLEYFIGLADILAAGGTNEVIEKLQSSKNLLFEKVFSEFKDNALFENDLVAGIRNLERKELKPDLILLDNDKDRFGIPDEEIKYSITQIERRALKKRLQEFEISFSNNHAQHVATLFGDIERVSYSKSDFNRSRIKLWKFAFVAAALILVIFTIALDYQFYENLFNKSKTYSSPKTIDTNSHLVPSIKISEDSLMYEKARSNYLNMHKDTIFK